MSIQLQENETMIKINFIFIIIALSFANAEDDKGLSHFKKGEFDKAIQYYESTLGQGGSEDKAHFGIGTSALSQGNVEMAMDAFERALNTEDDALKAKAYYNMGNALFNAKRNEESLAFFRKALELNPDDTDAKYNYEMIRYQAQENQEQQQNQDSNSEQSEDQDKQDQQKQESENKEEGDQKENQQKSEDDQKQDEGEQKESESQNGQNDQDENSEEQSPAKQDETSAEEMEDLRNAERILDALKEDEKILQKRQMARVKSRKLEKDW